MFPEKEFMKRFEAILSELDALAEREDDDTLDDLNAELEDALFMLSQIRGDDEDAEEALAETLEELRALAGDYGALEVEGVGEVAARLSMAADMALNNIGS